MPLMLLDPQLVYTMFELEHRSLFDRSFVWQPRTLLLQSDHRVQRSMEQSYGQQRTRHGATTGDQVGEHAKKDGEKQNRRPSREKKMILLLDEDNAYLHWVTHHRSGFVLNCSRHPTKAQLILHRSTCPLPVGSASK